MNDNERNESIDRGRDLTVERVRALKVQAAEVAAKHQSAEAQAIISELRALDDHMLSTADIAIVRDVVDTAGTLLPTGQFDALEQLFAKAIQALRNHAQATTADRFVPLNNLAALYHARGDYAARDRTNSAIVKMADQLTAPLDAMTLNVFIQLAQFCDHYGHLEDAAILYGQLYRYVMSSAAFGTDTRLALIAKYAQALVGNGQRDTAIAICEQSFTALEPRGEFADNHRLQLLGLTAQLVTLKGDLDKAQSLLERARDNAEQGVHSNSSAAGAVYHNLAALYLQRGWREHYDEAERLLERARDIVARNRPRESSEYAGEVAQLATVIAAKGEFDRADALFRDAFRLYEAAPDTNLEDFAQFLTDAGFMYLKYDHSVDATNVFDRARSVRESIRDVHPLKLAAALSNLATAQFESHDLANAIQNYRRAIELRHRCQEFVAAIGASDVDNLSQTVGPALAALASRDDQRLIPSEMKRVKQIDEENRRLKKLVADLSLDKEMLRDLIYRKI